MCQKKPGVRCYSSYKNAAEEAEMKLEDARLEESIAEDQYDQMVLLHQDGHAAEEDVREAALELEKRSKDRSRAVIESAGIQWSMDATKGGIERLRKQMDALSNSEDPEATQEEYDLLDGRLQRASVIYASQMREHDMEYGTVNGKKPSTEFSGIELNSMLEEYAGLSRKRRMLHEEAMVAKMAGDNVKAEELLSERRKIRKKAIKLRERFNHAKQTSLLVSKGIIPDPVSAEKHRETARKYAALAQGALGEGNAELYEHHVYGYQLAIAKADLQDAGGTKLTKALVDGKGSVLPYEPRQDKQTQRDVWVGKEGRLFTDSKVKVLPDGTEAREQEVNAPAFVATSWDADAKRKVPVVSIAKSKYLTHPHHFKLAR